MILDWFGYDRHGSIRELQTTLQRNALNTGHVALAAMAFNAPAWVAAASMSTLYLVVGSAAPLAILISFVFPMMVLALCLVYLTRAAPSAGGIFTFSSRFLHPIAGTILGWAYIIACAAVVPLTALIGTQYLQALVPALRGAMAANLIGTVLILAFMVVCLRGVTLTARLAMLFLTCELSVILGLGIAGIVRPHVPVPILRLYAPAGHWSVMGSGVLLGMWMLANFDSAINYIEEARVPVRTVQRALIIVLTAALVVYSVAGARTAYRMAQEGFLPAVFGQTNRQRAPAVAVIAIAVVAIAFIWFKPLPEAVFYYNAVVVTLALAYAAALAAFVRLIFLRQSFGRAALICLLPLFAIVVLGYLMYSAGAEPADPKDRFQAWYIGAGVLGTSLLVVLFGGSRKPLALAGEL